MQDMFLAFADKFDLVRIAYAASFGTADWEFGAKELQRHLADFSGLLRKFDAVSVREESGIALAKRLGAVEVQKVLDPTLALGRNGFDAIIAPYRYKPKDDYLCAYVFDLTDYAERHLKSLAVRLGVSEVLNFTEGQPDMGPGQWIDCISGSKIFITDSFHGTVFAILYHVPFMSVVNIDRGGDRFISLLRPLGLESRLVGRIEDISVQMFSDVAIDWTDVDMRLDALRRDSLNFLQQNLGNA